MENPLYLFSDKATLCRDILHPPYRKAAASSHSADLDIIESWSNTLNMSFNPDISISLSQDILANPPIYYLHNPLEEVQSLKHLGFTINYELAWGTKFLDWPPKQVADWASSVMQHHSMAHPLQHCPSARPSSTASWSNALPPCSD